MDRKEVTSDESLLGLLREGQEKGEGSDSPSGRRWKIKESMFLNYKSVCVDRSYSTGNPVKAGEDIDISNTALK
jgi:hypothetical protein